MTILRSYTPADFNAIIDLFLLNTPAYFCVPEQQDLEAFLREEVEQYFVMEEDGAIVACGGCNVEDNTGWLSWYIVHPDHQGKGLGKATATYCLKILKAHEGLKSIEVHTSQLVYPFYEKLGFVLTGTTDHYWGQDMHLYEMRLT